MTKLEMQDAPRVAFIMGSKSDWMGHVLILDENGQDGAEVAEAIAADLERAVAAGPGERAWT